MDDADLYGVANEYVSLDLGPYLPHTSSCPGGVSCPMTKRSTLPIHVFVSHCIQNLANDKLYGRKQKLL